ncbi:glycine receptor subunit alpha-3-like isoform X1 [Ptychodera flava]|uniref:glycine receptor subunit alpha-3-like isoform X1 n=1 Tax=Ptychodera flava TaxID=63121 RepID=UPI00396A9489
MFYGAVFFPDGSPTVPVADKKLCIQRKNVILKWRNVDNKTDPIDYSEDIELPQFTLKNVSEDTSVSILRLGNFTTLCARFTLERVMGFYIVHTYLPSFLLVIVSWITFWLHVEATAARASLGITTVLTVTTQVTSSRFTLPDVAYPTALDIWFSCCLVLVFSALLEFAFVNYVNLLDTKIRVPKMKVALTEDQESFEMEKYDTASSHVSGLSPGLQRRNVKNTEAIETSSSVKKGLPGKHRVGRATGIDRTCRILFPALFLTFNICYWSYYLTMRQTVPDHWRVTSCDSK